MTHMIHEIILRGIIQTTNLMLRKGQKKKLGMEERLVSDFFFLNPQQIMGLNEGDPNHKLR